MSTAVEDEYLLLDRLITKLRQVADDAGSLRKEFYSLPDNGNEGNESHEEVFSTSVGQKAENRKKNRYKDIVPYDSTRVVLTESQGGDSDYINANYVKGPTGKPTYIACQGPLKHTILDMWRMIWECGVRVVIMACNEKEGQKVKCERYWPSSVDEPLTIDGAFQIRLISESGEPQDEYVVRRMRVTLLRGNESQLIDVGLPSSGAIVDTTNESGQMEREVTQYHYVGWPDYGIPDNCTQLIQMLAQVRALCPSIDQPIVVHCSAGCGRTGTIMCVDYVAALIRFNALSADLSVKKIVMDMRQQRPAVVQSYDQYLMCVRSVIELLVRRAAELSGTPATQANGESANEVYENGDWSRSQTHVVAKPTLSRSEISELNTRPAPSERPLSTPPPDRPSRALDASPSSPFVPVVSPKRPAPPSTDLDSDQTVPPSARPDDADGNNNQSEWPQTGRPEAHSAAARRNPATTSPSTGKQVSNKMQSLFNFGRKQNPAPPRPKPAATKSASFDSQSMPLAKRDDVAVAEPLTETDVDGSGCVGGTATRDESRAAKMYQFVFRGIDVGFRKLVRAHPQGPRDPPWSLPPT